MEYWVAWPNDIKNRVGLFEHGFVDPVPTLGELEKCQQKGLEHEITFDDHEGDAAKLSDRSF